MKRRHWLNTQVGAIVGAIPPLMGYTAASGGSFGIEGTFVAAMLFCWQFPHYYSLAANKNKVRVILRSLRSIQRILKDRLTRWPLLTRNKEYTEARYRMLTTFSMRNAMWFSFWSLVTLSLLHLYILFYMQGQGCPNWTKNPYRSGQGYWFWTNYGPAVRTSLCKDLFILWIILDWSVLSQCGSFN